MTIDDIPETPGIWLPGGEWQNHEHRMLWIRSNLNDRVARLFAVVVARSVHCYLPQDERRPQNACDVAERYADGNATMEELSTAYASSYVVAYASSYVVAYASSSSAAAYAAAYASSASVRLWQSRLLTLYMPSPWNPRWTTDTTRNLAEIIYCEKAYDRVPILCDALMDADCDDEEMLTWLRGLPNETWQRGTWILDVLTGRN